MSITPEEIVHLGRYFASRLHGVCGVEYGEAESECVYYIWEASKRIDTTIKARRTAYFHKVCYGRLLHMRKRFRTAARYIENLDYARPVEKCDQEYVEIDAYDPILWLRVAEELSIDEIKAQTGMSRNQIRYHLARTIRTLRNEMHIFNQDVKRNCITMPVLYGPTIRIPASEVE